MTAPFKLTFNAPSSYTHPKEILRLMRPGDTSNKNLPAETEEALALLDQSAKPWAQFVEINHFDIKDCKNLIVESQTLTCRSFCNILSKSTSHSLLVLAVSIGKELEQAISNDWKTDAYRAFLLESCTSVVTEGLIRDAISQLCTHYREQKLYLTPYRSPGFNDWDLKDQPVLYAILKNSIQNKITINDQGVLSPKASFFTMMGISSHLDMNAVDHVERPCLTCDTLCPYRRLPAQK